MVYWYASVSAVLHCNLNQLKYALYTKISTFHKFFLTASGVTNTSFNKNLSLSIILADWSFEQSMSKSSKFKDWCTKQKLRQRIFSVCVFPNVLLLKDIWQIDWICLECGLNWYASVNAVLHCILNQPTIVLFADNYNQHFTHSD